MNNKFRAFWVGRFGVLLSLALQVSAALLGLRGAAVAEEETDLAPAVDAATLNLILQVKAEAQNSLPRSEAQLQKEVNAQQAIAQNKPAVDGKLEDLGGRLDRLLGKDSANQGQIVDLISEFSKVQSMYDTVDNFLGEAMDSEARTRDLLKEIIRAPNDDTEVINNVKVALETSATSHAAYNAANAMYSQAAAKINDIIAQYNALLNAYNAAQQSQQAQGQEGGGCGEDPSPCSDDSQEPAQVMEESAPESSESSEPAIDASNDFSQTIPEEPQDVTETHEPEASLEESESASTESSEE